VKLQSIQRNSGVINYKVPYLQESRISRNSGFKKDFPELQEGISSVVLLLMHVSIAPTSQRNFRSGDTEEFITVVEVPFAKARTVKTSANPILECHCQNYINLWGRNIPIILFDRDVQDGKMRSNSMSISSGFHTLPFVGIKRSTCYLNLLYNS
jgi:hypothetical protein